MTSLKWPQGWLLARHGVIALGIAIAAVVWSGAHLWGADFFHRAEELAGDFSWRLFASRVDERRLVIVDIDERSLQEVGQWPWTREQQKRLIDGIAAGGSRQQILDIVFSDGRPDDAGLIESIRRHGAVLAQIFAVDRGEHPSVGTLSGALDWTSCPPPFPSATGFIANESSLAGAAEGRIGHITPRVTDDGLVRHQPAIICSGGRSYPALALSALMAGTGEKSLLLRRGESWREPAWWLSGRSQAFPPIPLDERGDLRIPWRIHPDGLISISAADVLAGRVPSGLLDGAWVLVGGSAFGFNDSIATPFDGVSAGFLVHSQLILAMIDGRVPVTPRLAWLYLLGVGLLGVVLLAVMARSRERFPAYLIPLVGVLWAVVLWGLHTVLLVLASVWIGWAGPALFVLTSGLALGGLEHARSRADRDRLYAHLSSYLPAAVARSLALQPPSGAIRASTRQVSVLFADIRNFSAYCESRPPEEAAAVLHAFFSVATEVIEAHQGIVESLQGDAVVGVWNAESSPAGSGDDAGQDQESHAWKALRAAIALQAAVRGVLPDPAPAGLEPLALGIGVETGPAMSGSFGLASRRTHMVMGRTVTIASRLVAMTADLAHPILVGEGLAAQIGGVGLQSMGTFLLDGLRVPHHVYAPPVAPDPQP